MNQNPEQKARDNIDKQLLLCGWLVQGKKETNIGAGIGVAIREYKTKRGLQIISYLLIKSRSAILRQNAKMRV